MEQEVSAKCFNQELKIGLVNWREAWFFSGEYPEKLYTEVYRGSSFSASGADPCVSATSV